MSTRFALVLALTACAPKAHDVSSTFALSPSLPAGNLEVVLGDATRALSVTINDQLVVDRKHSRKAVVGGVPAGPARILVAIGGGCEQGETFERVVDIMPGATATVALPGPEISTGCALWQGLAHIGINVGMAATSIALIGVAMSGRR